MSDPSTNGGNKRDAPTNSTGDGGAGNDGNGSKRARTDGDGRGGKGGGQGGGRGGRGRGGRGGGGRGGGRGGKAGTYRGRRPGDDNRSWGGRNTGAAVGKMRSWGPKEGTGEEKADRNEENKERLPKKKVAVFFGYNGQGYKGSQINPGEATTEGELWQAFIKAGCVSADNADDYRKVSLQRAARTDAGVHAAVNIITLKLILAPADKPEEQRVEDWINSLLPPTIRVWNIVRVQAGFEPRKVCDQRNYEYSMPTHVFLGPKPSSNLGKWLEQNREEFLKTEAEAVEGSVERTLPACVQAAKTATADFWATQSSENKFLEDVAAKKTWRITPELLNAARAFIKAYEGSHNFHNYTVASTTDKSEPRDTGGKRAKKGGPQDVASMRVLRSLSISDPFIVNGVEYVSVDLLGQSFMLHQIRKMIGLLILAVRSGAPPSLIASTFTPQRIHIPKAPALGLLLLEPQYLEYNKRILEHNVKINALDKLDEAQKTAQRREQIGVVEQTDQVNAFKRDEIYKVMWEVEEKEGVFAKWVNYVDVFEGRDFAYLNPEGTVPECAVYKPGERSDQPRRRARKQVVENGEGAEDALEQAKGEGEEDVQPPSDDERADGEDGGDE
ncbi:hypothetical protein MVLG_05087 [Microbotryum lychnidis-dioicae p1A1 Lamole]|uniref:tRNA pseudouridine synthase 1 n=1 Tax=Microbotryum lychnidis-dioicae (strain p1A1 Lamole / MvSl-1064) TaxID=683840 RepID=U5HD70_USTV1|nr:hypothetical protein MVLG_05087 [Microbotryum lychnidis-dioicae p1A1 Lamole]|eukprot:KDE04521.1 hypothetical protein MVLG_05087 [Microbotryum lychnidis-dioicae p1A1 Lamole]